MPHRWLYRATGQRVRHHSRHNEGQGWHTEGSSSRGQLGKGLRTMMPHISLYRVTGQRGRTTARHRRDKDCTQRAQDQEGNLARMPPKWHHKTNGF